MSIAADALQPYFLRQMSSVQDRGGLKHFADVITSSRVGFDLGFDDDLSAISIDFREPEFICTTLYTDATRFACAAFTTLSMLNTEVAEFKLLPWAFIKFYYSAFYAGHAILRCIGQSCSFLDGSHVNRIRKLALATGATPAFGIDAGLYHVVVEDSQNSFRMVKARGTAGGEHEAFWKVFGEMLSGLNETVLNGHLSPDSARAVFAQVENLRRALRLSDHAGYNWLSHVRNEIQYRHSFGVWLPERLRKQKRDQIIRIVGRWQCDPMSLDLVTDPDDWLAVFAFACTIIVSLCYALFRRAAERSQVGSRCFALSALKVVEA